MIKHFIASLAVICLGASVSLAQETQGNSTKNTNSLLGKFPDAEPSVENATIQKMIAAYAAAFNSHDADSVAAHWSEQGVHVVKDSGERTEGREAIQTDFATLFKNYPEAALGVKVDSVRLIKPEVAVVEGVARVGLDEGPPSDTAFTAIVLNSGGKWLIDSIHETALPEPPTAADYLDQLGWMVGDWVDESNEVRVDTNVRWAANNSFLIRSYTVRREGELELQGTQVIGWCPRTEKIRCWMFDSDGSFGDGIWTATDNGWQIDSTLTRSDGRLAKGTQLLKVVDENTVTVQRTALEVHGEKHPPSDPVRIIRVLADE